MIEIRPLHQDEIPTAQQLIPEGSPYPDWGNCWAVFDGPELTQLFAIEERVVVEPFYSKDNKHALQAFGAMTWIDGFIRGAVRGKAGYEFFVSDANPRFQEFIKRQLPVKEGREKSGLYYFRKFEV